jgi:hypothetical protein
LLLPTLGRGDSAALVDKGSFGGDPPDDISRGPKAVVDDNITSARP